MTITDPQGGNISSNPATDFTARHPSQAWEQLPFSDDPQQFVWVWFKPQGLPNAFTLRIPDEVWQSQQQPALWTMRRLLQPVGIEPRTVAMWQLYGVTYDGMQGTSPLFDQPIPAPPPGTDPGIIVYVVVPQAMPLQPMFHAAPMQPVASQSTAGNDEHGDVYERIETDWNAILELEVEVKALRKNLLDTQGRLKSLNRDLGTDERIFADSMDTKDWLEARRALRDAGLRLSVCLKEIDMGDFSSAGQRSWFENIYKQFVVPHQQFDNMQQALSDFAYHRKMVATLQGSLNGALLNAKNGGERRAQQVLNRIAAKVRDGQSRKNFLGAMLD